MKRTESIRQLVAAGCVLLRHGSRHEIYLNPATGLKQPVPKHSEIDDKLVEHVRHKAVSRIEIIS